MPPTDRRADLLCKAKMFSTFDANSGYQQIEVNDKYIYETAFVKHHGMFKYTEMPVWTEKRTCNAPACNGCHLSVSEVATCARLY